MLFAEVCVVASRGLARRGLVLRDLCQQGNCVVSFIVYPYFELEIKQDAMHKTLFILIKEETESLE